MSDPLAPLRVEVPPMEDPPPSSSSKLGSNYGSLSPNVAPTIDASGRVVFAEVEGAEEIGLEHEAPPGFGYQVGRCTDPPSPTKKY
jgi:hypothetical protein